MRTRSILLWPFKLLLGLARLLFWPAIVLALGYGAVWLDWLPSGLYILLVAAVAFYTLYVLRLWVAVAKGSVRSMARGTVTVRQQRTRRTRRGGSR